MPFLETSALFEYYAIENDDSENQDDVEVTIEVIEKKVGI